MEQNKNFRLLKSENKNESRTSNYTGIRSLFKEPIQLYKPTSESSGIFTKRYDLRRYKSVYR